VGETQVVGRAQAVRVGPGDLGTAPFPPPAVTGLAGLFKRPASRWARAALVAVNLAAVAAFLLSYSRHGVGFGPYRIDLGVYRLGGRTWLHGGDLYGQVLVTGGLRLPFTYPPIAAVVLAPLALLPMTATGTLLTVGSIALVTVVLGVFLRRLAWPTAESVWALGWLLPPALLLEPVRSTLAYGQVNIVLMALVTLDCLTAEPRWPRGALTGLAAAVKLTPAVFVLFFLLRRDYRAAATAVGSFAAATAIGFALAGPDSVRYWTAAVFQTGRIGGSATAANQSIQAVLARAGLDPHTLPGAAAWLALSALVVMVACRGMRHALAASQDCLALSLNAFAALLISPVSWSHHWVWCAPGLLTLADLGRRHRRRLAAAAAAGGLVLFALAPQWLLGRFAGPEPRWAAWQQAIGSSYVLFAALVLVLSACGQLTPPTPAPRASDLGHPPLDAIHHQRRDRRPARLPSGVSPLASPPPVNLPPRIEVASLGVPVRAHDQPRTSVWRAGAYQRRTPRQGHPGHHRHPGHQGAAPCGGPGRAPDRRCRRLARRHHGRRNR
jgi:alpha-1,2-mannosyltransferase